MTIRLSEDDFDEFYKGDHHRLCVYLHLRGATWAEAEEIADETYFRLYREWGTVQSPQAWARKTAGNMLTDLKPKRAKLLPLSDNDSPYTQPIFDGGAERVVKLLQVLPQRQREILSLTIDGFQPREIALILGIAPNSVSSSLRHARRRLKDIISESGLGGLL